MSEAIRDEVGRASFGLVLFWGDPSGPHERTIDWVLKKISAQLRGYCIETAGQSNTELETSSGTSGNESVPRLFEEVRRWAQAGHNAIGCKIWHSDDAGFSVLILVQEQERTDFDHATEAISYYHPQHPSGTIRATRMVTQNKEPDASFLDSRRVIMTAVEVAWRNESLSKLLDELHRWSQSGRNGIGFKLWLSKVAGASILSRSVVIECHTPAVVLPAAWFCLDSGFEELSERPPRPVIWSLSELALLLPILKTEDDAEGLPAEEANPVLDELEANRQRMEFLYAQAEVDDLVVAEGLAEEVREELLQPLRDRLALKRRRWERVDMARRLGP
ncbi:hypothetical protein BCV69DRAFT_308174 [Microstroma glucosiphilum]|uniref:Uncharacterized protein n=1 Tax=Pseudomicrostroma glucosiphilum TaxID=1684307 RepID=A0A316U8Q2_9BASI|nr:hypothetical protein BCV69DRAFT_308174 [Pseudomicrostroma glucosiphilum]PWN21224.1 hypothetical protein BCV69DRAFT_308174 [Pseudomicrostroma glucosiphilum]